MVKPGVTEDELRRTHRLMRIATPFEGMSELLRAALAAAARAMLSRDRQRSARRAAAGRPDMKRRAGGDFVD
ncbi:hypothetical protein AU476_21130 [Cupriavidus sp. UYMSc13B]|nr:hypothetical protein AU476_21130 [Cupriavidus sp. UYMSc13B]